MQLPSVRGLNVAGVGIDADVLKYYEKLKKAIKKKINGNEIVETKDETEPVKIINLMDALQKSLKKAK